MCLDKSAETYFAINLRSREHRAGAFIGLKYLLQLQWLFSVLCRLFCEKNLILAKRVIDRVGGAQRRVLRREAPFLDPMFSERARFFKIYLFIYLF